MACDRVTLQGTEAPKAVTNFPSERVGPSEACQPEALRPLQVTRRKDGRALSTHTWDQVKAQHPEEHSRAGCSPRSLGTPTLPRGPLHTGRVPGWTAPNPGLGGITDRRFLRNADTFFLNVRLRDSSLLLLHVYVRVPSM